MTVLPAATGRDYLFEMSNLRCVSIVLAGGAAVIIRKRRRSQPNSHIDDNPVTAAEIADAGVDGSAVRRVHPCGGRSVAPFPNRREILLPSRDPLPSGGVRDQLVSIVEPNAVT